MNTHKSKVMTLIIPTAFEILRECLVLKMTTDRQIMSRSFR
jgi:hypothetical protein